VLRVCVIGKIGADRTTVIRRLIEHGAIEIGEDEIQHRAAPDDTVGVHDASRFEAGMAPTYHLVIYVAAAGGGHTDNNSARGAIADVVLTDEGHREKLLIEVDALWAERIVHYARNTRSRRMALYGPPRLVAPDPTWPEQAERLAARIRYATGARVEHIGSTSIPGLTAKDVIDLQVSVASLDHAESISPDLLAVGLVRHPGIDSNQPHGAVSDPDQWRKHYYKSADPGRPANVHVRPYGTAGWRFALLFRDWLRADAQIRAEYLMVKRNLAHRFAGDADTARYGLAKDPWFATVFSRMEEWARTTGWRGPPAPPTLNAP
jgi:dephospho-CoA kinase